MGLFSRHAESLKEEWSFNANATMVCRPSVGRFHAGTRIILGTKDGRLVCLDEKGVIVWEFKTQEHFSATEQYFVDEERVHSFDTPPVIADVNHDGEPEILAATELGVLYCLSSSGALLWQHDCKAGVRASPLVADVNMDGHTEILIGSQDGKLTLLANTGEIILEFIVDSPIESTPGVMKSHGQTLIIFGTDKGELFAINTAQDIIWKVALGNKITAAPTLYSTREEQRIVIGTLSGSMFCISEHGEIVWEFKTNGSIYNKAAIYDVDEDGSPEIIFGSCDNNVYAITSDGNRLWSYETDFWVTDTPVVADIDGDGRVEVIAGSYDHNVYVLDSRGEYMMDYVPGVSGIIPQAGHYASVLTSDPGEQTGKKLYGFHMDDIITGCTLKEGAHPSLVVTTKAGNVRTLRPE